MTSTFKCKWVGLFLVSAITLGCDSGDNVSNQQGNVTLSSPSIEPDGNLSINATARFDVEITDLENTSVLIYDWSLQAARGTLVVNGQDMGNQAQTSDPFVTVRGDNVGEETIKSKVLNADTGNSLGEDFLTFEITTPSGSSICYDEPLLFYRDNDWYNPTMFMIGLESDTKKTTELSPQNWIMDISPNGNWFIRQDYSDARNYKFWLDACNGSESKLLTEGLQIFSPIFGPNGEYVYYSELISYPVQTQDPRARELVRINVETGEKVFISDFGVFSKEPKVSPDGKWIAFEHSKETFNANGSYIGSIIHFAVMPSEGGPTQFLVELDANVLDGFSWSPDSEHLIFNWHNQNGSTETQINGIYRVYLNGGGTPSLIFPEPNGGGYPTYYNNGNRIAFHGYPSGNDTQYDIWSIDANGDDLKRLTNESYNVLLMFTWQP